VEQKAYRSLPPRDARVGTGLGEHSLKTYVAYEAEIDFVDVVPQVARMRLSLNCTFESLHDERDLAWDVTGKGH
jgi:predicted transport protein